jgi:hypothetical protein
MGSTKPKKSFKNELSWSYSRHKQFEQCLRQYYLSRYESWGGWSHQDFEHPHRKPYVLKHLQNIWSWKGDVFHRKIAEYIHAGMVHHDPDRCLDSQENILTEVGLEMQQGWNSSTRLEVKQFPKEAVTLMEHMYDTPIRGSLLSHITDVQRWLQNLWSSPLHDAMLEALGKEHWLYCEELNTMTLFKVPCYVKMDFVWNSGKTPFLITDWKTGKVSPQHHLQLGIYALYAHRVLQIPLKDIRVLEVYVAQSPIETISSGTFTEGPLEETLDFVHDSIIGMRQKLTNYAKNTPKSKLAFPKNLDHCKFCAFRGICEEDK